jgi:hypothetical protein
MREESMNIEKAIFYHAPALMLISATSEGSQVPRKESDVHRVG